MSFGFLGIRHAFLGVVLILSLIHVPGAWALSSYAIDATDEIGATGSSTVALGVPDYSFVNDSGIGFAGNTDVFDVGEVAVFSFPKPLRAIVGQHDLVISAYVGGLGETDNAMVQVEVSSDGTVFTLAATFNTQEARNRSQDTQENNHAGVKHFWIDFNGADNVSFVRLSNLAGTVEGLRLDAIEGLHPVVGASHAFEIRLDRYRPDANERFAVRIKNIADVGGVPIREFRIDRPTDLFVTLEDTANPLDGLNGSFICVENCIPDNGPLIPFTRLAWSTDGVTEAASGLGLDPGQQAALDRSLSYDVDTAGTTYLSGYTFTITFTDGLVQVLDYDTDFLIAAGELYQKYQYFDAAPIESGPRPVDYSEWRRRSVVTFSNPASVGAGHSPGVGGRLVATSQNFIEDGMHVESFWVPNDSTTFVQGHFHSLENLYELSHGFESTPGLGPDTEGVYLERVDGGAFDLESLDYWVTGSLTATSLLISPTYDPALPAAGQFIEFPVVANPTFATLDLTQFTNVTTLFVMAVLSEDQLERVGFDDFVIHTIDPVTIAPTAIAGPDLVATDTNDDGLETVSVDGSASFDIDGSLTSWTWLEGGLQIATGSQTDIPFAVGRHDVTLQVLDDDGNPATDTLQVQINPPGGLPFAEAGPNQDVMGDGSGSALVSLDGSGSFDSNGLIVSWAWSESGVSLGGGKFLTMSLSTGVHTIDLVVTDDTANIATSSVVISVNSLGTFPPTADAGMNVFVTDVDTDGFETVTLDGSGSTDSDGIITSWSWSEAGVSLGTGQTLPMSFAVGVHSVDLVVQDDSGNSSVGEVTIIVQAGVVIQPVKYVAHETSAQTSNSTTHTLGVSTLPIAAGDLLMAHICSDGGTGLVITCPVGWTQVEQGSHYSNGVFGAICIKQADATDESATSYQFTTSGAQQSQSGVILFQDQEPSAPIDVSARQGIENDVSPQSPSLSVTPLPSSRIVRFMCANAGQVTEGVGFPAGMVNDLWVLESADGLSGPVSGGAAIDGLGFSNAAEWTNALASAQQSVNFTVAIAGRPVSQVSNPPTVPSLSGPAYWILVVLATAFSALLIRVRASE